MKTAPTTDLLTLRVGCTFDYQSIGLVPAVCLVRPAGVEGVRLLGESWMTTPTTPYYDYIDVYGNMCRRLTLPPGVATISYDAQVSVPDAVDAEAPYAAQTLVEDLPDEVLAYTLPSRFCLSDELIGTAWSLFGGTTPGWWRVRAIVDYVHTHVTFGYHLTAPTKTSSDVLSSGTGVCRDFAHAAIAFCRAMSIPARYVFGYLPDIDVPAPDSPMDFCAWFEAFLDGSWWTFDPRNNQLRKGRVIVARGRDAADVAMVTTFGNAAFRGMKVWADPV